MFSSEDPQLWRYHCENYFDMYGVEQSLWVRVASMHVEGAAVCWLQFVERRMRSVGWGEFCAMTHDHFGRDQHEALIRQLFHIHQMGYATEYVEQFASLIDQLATYDSTPNPLYYAMRFVDGLHYDIKSMIMIQRPSSFDTACTLDLVQEEVVDFRRKKDYHCLEPLSHRMVPQ
jgi:hypothetical protein